MGRAKEIEVRVIPANVAVPFVKKHHYSGTVSHTSCLHFGCFLDGSLHGVMSFGAPMDKGKVINLVTNTRWNEMLELNRMAFDDVLPKNSESRCLSIAIRLLRKNAPQIKWLLSFSDGTQSGDGTIYRATGFYLTQVKKSTQIIETPWCERITRFTLTNVGDQRRAKTINRLGLSDNGKASISMFLNAGCKNIDGFQLRYIYLIDKTLQLNCPILPFSAIDEMGAGMYRGKRITLKERQAAIAHSGEHPATSREGAFDATAPLNLDEIR